MFSHEDYINGFEDFELSFEINISGRYKILDFEIGSYIGSSLGGPDNPGKERLRDLRDIANFNYFDEYFKHIDSRNSK